MRSQTSYGSQTGKQSKAVSCTTESLRSTGIVGIAWSLESERPELRFNTTFLTPCDPGDAP